MAYGTEAGVKVWIQDYDALVTASELSPADTTEFLEVASAIIDTRIADAVGVGNIPLSSPPSIVTRTANKLAACYILKRLFTDKDPNASDWVEEICKQATDMLDALAANPEILNLNGVVQEDQFKSTTLNQDRKLSPTTSSSGTDTTGDQNNDQPATIGGEQGDDGTW